MTDYYPLQLKPYYAPASTPALRVFGNQWQHYVNRRLASLFGVNASVSL